MLLLSAVSSSLFLIYISPIACLLTTPKSFISHLDMRKQGGAPQHQLYLYFHSSCACIVRRAGVYHLLAHVQWVAVNKKQPASRRGEFDFLLN
jgi:hypothetical protein